MKTLQEQAIELLYKVFNQLDADNEILPNSDLYEEIGRWLSTNDANIKPTVSGGAVSQLSKEEIAEMVTNYGTAIFDNEGIERTLTEAHKMEKETKHWTTSLQEGDFVFATIRHQTDGSKNRHNVKLRVIDVDLKKKQIKGVENGSFYFVTFNELYQSPKQDQRNLEKETEKPFYQFVTKINGSDESGIANITEPSILCICRESDADIIIPALNDYAALKSERDRLEKAIQKIQEIFISDNFGVMESLDKIEAIVKGLKQEGEG